MPRPVMPVGRTPIVGVGAGGHAKSVVDAVRSRMLFRVVCLVDADPRRHGTEVLGVPVVGDEGELAPLLADGVSLFVGIGGTRSLTPRRRVYERLRERGAEIPVILHRTAVLATSARVGDGAQILAGAVVGPDAAVGEDAIVNAGVVVGHDAVVGAHCHVASGARLAGGVVVGAGTVVGAGAVVLGGRRIGAGAVVGAGSVVTRDVPDGAVVAGSPARSMGTAGRLLGAAGASRA